MEPHRKGDLTESIVISEMIRRGIPVSRPFTDNERYDIVVEDPQERLHKVQIKTGWIDDGSVTVKGNSQHTNSGGNVYKPYAGDVDFCVIYCPETDGLYLLKESELTTTVHLRIEDPKQHHRNMRWARNYEFDRRWPSETDGMSNMTGSRDPIASEAIDSLNEIGAHVFVSEDENCREWIAAKYDDATYVIRTERGRISDGRIHFEAAQKEMVDAYLIYVPDLERLYAVAADGFDSTITLRLDPPKRHQPGIKYAEEFEFERNWPPSRLSDPLAGAGEQTRRTVEELESLDGEYELEQTGGAIPTVIATVEEERYRIRPERGWRTDGCLQFEPTDGSFDMYAIYDPDGEALYLLDAEEAGSSCVLRLEEPEKWESKIKMAEEYRFRENWPPMSG